ncbi:MAG: hypothetical protein KKE50_00245 [Nanoarchaeota archaeon]|nr:hypothetical protein [Nanoarchaeota archaeon]
MDDPFLFLPLEEPVFFIDTCAFSIKDSGPGMGLAWSSKSLEEIQIETIRLNMLNRRLEDRKNWLVTSEVIQEIENGNRGLEIRTREDFISQTHKVVYSKLLHSRKQTLELISQSERNANHPDNLINELSAQISTIEPLVRTRFKGRTRPELETDIHLIATALAYSQQIPIAIYTRDNQIITTFGILSHELKTEKTYILSDDEEIISAYEFARRILSSRRKYKARFAGISK